MADRLKVYDDFETLAAGAREDGRKILDKSLAPKVRRILKQHIEDDIYGAYQPKEGAWVNGTTYERRKKLAKMVEHQVIDDELLVTSTETANKSVVKGYSFSDRYAGSFLELLESGHMGIWKKGFARPAVSNAQEDIETDPTIDQAIRDGLAKYMGEFDII